MYLDGTTAGPTAFSGELGKSLQKCHDLPVIIFESRQNNLPVMLKDVAEMDLSKDQRYLYDMCKSIEAGQVSDSLARRQPGPLIHSRWLTTANRILRLYISTLLPSTELLLLTDYILQVYAPVWFSIKLEPQCYNGAKHFYRMVKLSRFLPDDARAKVDKCLQQNAYFAHSENLLLSMLVDERREIRELAVRRIQRAKQNKETEVRRFERPAINLEAADYHELIDWQTVPRTQPPMMFSVTEDELNCAIETAKRWKLDDFPCHTQSVERHVKLVTEAAGAVCGEQRRDGFIRAKLLSRKIMSKFSSKQNWKSK
jgi:hypothetical protein